MKEKVKSYRSYSEEFKMSVIKDYYENDLKMIEVVHKYNLSCRKVFQYWLEKYPINDKSLSLSDELILSLMSKQKNTSAVKSKTEELEEEVSRLRKALAYSELRNEALHEVLKIGKDEYGIDLLKKAGAK